MKFQKFSKSHRCPTCKGTDAYRVKRVGLAMRLVCSVSNYRPHWCPNCDTFFLAPRQSRSVKVERRFDTSKPQQGGAKPSQAAGLPH